MKKSVRILCGLFAALWLPTAGAMGPGAATPADPHPAAVTGKVDPQANKGRLEKKGKRSRQLQKARKPAPQAR